MMMMDLIVQRMNVFVEKEVGISAETIEEALGEQVDQALLDNAPEKPSEDPTGDPECEEPNEIPMEDLVMSDNVLELELPGKDGSADKAEDDKVEASDEVAESMEMPALRRSERIRGGTTKPSWYVMHKKLQKGMHND
jgi:hypothetical protein